MTHETATILLVEDGQALRAILQRTLERAGFTVIVAGDGVDAINQASAHSGRIDLLLTDMVLPTLSGPRLYDRLKADRNDLRVLYTSGYSRDDLTARGLLDENMKFIAKPFALADLVIVLREMIGE